MAWSLVLVLSKCIKEERRLLLVNIISHSRVHFGPPFLFFFFCISVFKWSTMSLTVILSLSFCWFFGWILTNTSYFIFLTWFKKNLMVNFSFVCSSLVLQCVNLRSLLVPTYSQFFPSQNWNLLCFHGCVMGCLLEMWTLFIAWKLLNIKTWVRFTTFKILLSLFLTGNLTVKNFTRRENCDSRDWWISALGNSDFSLSSFSNFIYIVKENNHKLVLSAHSLS